MAEIDCREVEELLPWFEHGGLTPEERRRIELHLAECERCRTAAAATREAGALFAAHPPPGALVDHAFGLEVEEVSRTALELHLAHCEECREELRLIASEPPASRVAALAGTGEPSPIGWSPRGISWPRALALAAALAIASGFSVRLAMRSEATAGGRVALIELESESSRRRGEADRPFRLARREATTILLLTDRAGQFDEVRARVLAASNGSELWRSEDLLPAGEGAFALHLPARSLVAGAVVIELEGRRGTEWQRLERYLCTVDP